MKSRSGGIIMLGALLALIAWVLTRSGEGPPSSRRPLEKQTMPPAEAPVAPPLSDETVVPPAAAVPPLPAPAPAAGPRTGASRAAGIRDIREPLAAASSPPATPPPRRVSDAVPEASADFDKIALMFRNYRTLTGENPVGTNAEIMEAVIGGNPKGAKLGPPEGQQLNPGGELIDRWGSPYFFHQLTRDRIEIRSAGPDRVMWNEDDLTGD